MPHKQHFTEPPHDHATDWFRHIPTEEGLPQEEHGSHTRPIALAVAFVVCFGFVAVTILATYLYFQVHMTTLRREKIEDTFFAQEFNESKAAEEEKLGDYYFASDDLARKGIVTVP